MLGPDAGLVLAGSLGALEEHGDRLEERSLGLVEIDQGLEGARRDRPEGLQRARAVGAAIGGEGLLERAPEEELVDLCAGAPEQDLLVVLALDGVGLAARDQLARGPDLLQERLDPLALDLPLLLGLLEVGLEGRDLLLGRLEHAGRDRGLGLAASRAERDQGQGSQPPGYHGSSVPSQL